MEFPEQLLGDSQSENDKIKIVPRLMVLIGSSGWNAFVVTGNSI